MAQSSLSHDGDQGDGVERQKQEAGFAAQPVLKADLCHAEGIVLDRHGMFPEVRNGAFAR